MKNLSEEISYVIGDISTYLFTFVYENNEKLHNYVYKQTDEIEKARDNINIIIVDQMLKEIFDKYENTNST